MFGYNQMLESTLITLIIGRTDLTFFIKNSFRGKPQRFTFGAVGAKPIHSCFSIFLILQLTYNMLVLGLVGAFAPYRPIGSLACL